MSRNTFVYSHPINVFIIKYLGVTVASWITRNRRVESLPVGFIYDLGLAASSNMSSTYEELLSLQDEYEIYISSIGKRKKNELNNCKLTTFLII
ncbi:MULTISPECIES: type III secretion system protein PrgN [unclassified Enterococcus]|uniref:type III secretion system protein PrgN n=1 Tax=unclassified Enterococcus TaxID=2608891 RepID=UPI001F61F123|nr:type III secretion system protein PrgN [Enterococcus sp. DIV1271a]